jgi:hypothetical protein
LNLGARRIYNQGVLFGVSTIHFVRWVIIDKGRRLLFMTNYDGSRVAYVNDFVTRSWQVPWVLTAIWTNTIGFLKSRWLVLDGARDGAGLTAFLVRHRVPTLVWYIAYERLTTGNILNNAKIRRGLFAELDEQETAAWLGRF